LQRLLLRARRPPRRRGTAAACPACPAGTGQAVRASPRWTHLHA